MAHISSHLEKKKKLRWRIQLALGVALFTLIGGGLTYFLTASSMVQVQGVTVSGSKLFSEESVRESVSAAVKAGGGLSKFFKDTNILFWHSRAITEVPESFYPNIAEIVVSRSLWHRTVTIDLHEREKKAVWCVEAEGGESCVWVSEEGYALQEAPLLEGRVIPIVHERSSRTINKGDHVVEPDEMKNFLTAFAILDELPVTVSSITISEPRYREFEAHTEEGPLFYFSFLVDPAYARKVLHNLRNSSEWGMIGYIDVRIENKVYYRPW